MTQGSGDIQLYARDSILLGQSRIMTTFGGGILAWSAEGDINAGRGAKTTVVYTPPRRVYDAFGNVALSPNAPSSGAGIATLAPIAEVPAGDVDLHAPLGTIDAGEAGIRVSGNINIAALHVVNAANIQVKGESNGIPAAATVNTGALASASAASSAAAGAAQESVQRAQQQSRQNLPSVISVQILGYGDEPAAGATPPSPRAAAPAGSRYDSASAVQILGSRRAGAGRDARPDGTGARQTVEVMAAVETLLPVMSVSHRRGAKTDQGPEISGPWSVPAGLPRAPALLREIFLTTRSPGLASTSSNKQKLRTRTCGQKSVTRLSSALHGSGRPLTGFHKRN